MGARVSTSDGVPREVVGSLAQEAALLAAAVRDWAAANGGPDAADGHFDTADGQPAGTAPTGTAPTGAAANATAPGAAGSDAHGGRDGSWPCCACPVCRVLASVREEHVEVAGHLVDAAVSLSAAARAAWTVWGASGHRGQAAGEPADPAGPRHGATGRERSEAAAGDRVRPAETGHGGGADRLPGQAAAPYDSGGPAARERGAGTDRDPFPAPGFPPPGFPPPGRGRETGAGLTTSAGSPRPRVQKIDVR